MKHDGDRLGWKETSAILAVVVLGLLVWEFWPGTRWWLMVMLVGGVPLLFIVVLLFWHLWSLYRGLGLRIRKRWRVEQATESRIVLWRAGRSVELGVAAIARGRLAQNGNWTESRIVEDALTLFDRKGKALLKVPVSTDGFQSLLDVLAAKGIPVAQVEVDAPAFLD